jgi:hypothetical protein
MSALPALLLLTLLVSAPADATTSGDIPCAPDSPPPAPCVVGGLVQVTAGSILDFAARALVVAPGGELNVGTGAMTVRAAAVTLQAGGKLTGAGGSITVLTTGPIRVEASPTRRARVDVSAPGSGDISLDAGTAEVRIDGQLLASSTAAGGDGGFVDVNGGAVTLGSEGRIAATGDSGGGTVTIWARTLQAFGAIDVSGGDFGGGEIALDADTELIAGTLTAVSAAGGSGAIVDVRANGPIILAGPISAPAGASADGGGIGGDVAVFSAQGGIELRAPLDVSGAGLDGWAGEVDLTGQGDVVQAATIDARATGAAGVAGTVTLLSGASVVLDDVVATGVAEGGRIDALAASDVRVGGVLDASGPRSAIDLQGCGVTVPAGSGLSALGQAGSNKLHASGQLVVGGFLAAGAANRLAYRTAPPVVTGTVTPAAAVVQDTTLPECGLPPGATTTSTTTSSTTTTATSSTSTTSTSSLPPSTATITSTTTTSPSTSTAATSSSTTTTAAATSSTTTAAGSSTTTTATSTSTTSTLAPRPGGCTPGDPSACEDGDRCTEDACAGEAGCVHAARVGYDGVACRLETLAAQLRDAPVDAFGGARARLRLEKRVDKIGRLVEAARATGRRPLPRLRRAARLLAAFAHAVQQGVQRGKVAPDVAAELLVTAGRAADQLLPLEAQARSAR